MYDVVIIGAGIAGLGAARVLTRQSHDILVLEARTRPGGRIHGVRLPPLCPPENEGATSTLPTTNHDHLSVFLADHTEHPQDESVVKSSNSESGDSNNSETQHSKNETHEALQPTSPDFPMGPVDVDLGANYLIGCSNRQSDQPLFHMARILGIPTATCVGDLCKKYRGWECAELAMWRDHRQPDAPVIPIAQVAEAAFLFDKVVHLAVHNHLKLKAKLEKLVDEQNVHSKVFHGENVPTVKQFIDEALNAILQSEAHFGLRPCASFRDDVESGIFHSIIMRYLAYVNPLDRLPHTVLDELCEVATPRWHLSMNGATLQSLGLQEIPVRKLTLADRLALLYPSQEQREAYQVWADRKLEALVSGQAGSSPSVARTVNVAWEDRLVTGRFSDLLLPLMDKVPIVYNAVVTDIDWSVDTRTHGEILIRAIVRRPSGDGGTLLNENDETTEEVFYRAKHCIITVPVGVLKGLDPRSKINFHPELPASKRSAIERLGPPFFGAPTHEKVILRFRVPDDVFWDTQAAHLKCLDPRLHILNLHRYGKPGVLCAHIWGGSGLSRAGSSDQDLVNVILDLLNQMYPSTTPPKESGNGRQIPEPVYYVVTRWSEDPFALAAYTTGEPGSSDADRLAYAASLTDMDARQLVDELNITDQSHTTTKPCPRLLFAGEGTLTATEAKECTHGALQTGILRALELLPFLAHHSPNTAATNSEMAHKLNCDNHRDRLPIGSLSPSQIQTILLSKLAHYLVGKPLRRWLSNLHHNTYGIQHHDRVHRTTRSVGNRLNGLHSQLSDALDLKTVVNGTARRRQRQPCRPQSDVCDSPERTISLVHHLRSNHRRKITGRGISNAARTTALARKPKRPRRSWLGSVRRRRSEAVRSQSHLHRSMDSQSETSSATIEARLSCNSTWGPDQCTSPCPVANRYLTSFRELSGMWHLFPTPSRQRILAELSDLLDELHSRHVLLETQDSAVFTSSPVHDTSLHVMKPENPMNPFPFPY